MSNKNTFAGSVLRFLRSFLLHAVIAGVTLCIFAMFHHVIPRMNARNETPTAAVTVTAVPEPTAVTAEPQTGYTEETEEEPDSRTEWQIRFADYFTDETIITDHSYSSPNLSVNITTYVEKIGKYQQTYYVADIYIASLENLATYAAGETFLSSATAYPLEMAEASGAVLSINGDFVNSGSTGFFVRNWDQYQTDNPSQCDICVLYSDGTMQAFQQGTYEVGQIQEENPYQVWKFGPVLVDNGTAITDFSRISGYIRNWHPRTGIGYYEPGHYCFVVVDGRQSHSYGITLNEFADIFENLGCTMAYNLDGGASSSMVFEDSLFSIPCKDRRLGDIILVRDTAADGNSEVEADALDK